MSAVDQVRAYLAESNVHPDARFYTTALREVMALHSEHRIYEHCGHLHLAADMATSTVSEIGVVCEDGYLYSICRECCMDQYESSQSEECCDNHNRGLQSCWPCSTVMAIAEGLGIEPAEAGPQLDGDRVCPCNPKTDVCGCPTLPIRECRCYRFSLEPGHETSYPYRDETSAVSS